MFAKTKCQCCGGDANFHVQENGPVISCAGCGWAFQFSGRVLRMPDPEKMLALGQTGTVMETAGTKEFARAMKERETVEKMPENSPGEKAAKDEARANADSLLLSAIKEDKRDKAKAKAKSGGE